MMPKQPLALLFDLDGTLVDSAPDLASALDSALREQSLAPAGIDNTRLWVGGGARLLIERALAARLDETPRPSAVDGVLARFLHHYARCNGQAAALYPGIATLLETLSVAGHRLACVTNKPAAFVAPLLRTLGIEAHFDLWIGGDTLGQRKPHPAPLLHAAGNLGRDSSASIMIGDSRTDADAARAAGMRFVWVSYGYHRGDTAQTLQPHASADTAAELHAILDNC